jgi:hypothetical protein
MNELNIEEVTSKESDLNEFANARTSHITLWKIVQTVGSGLLLLFLYQTC